VPAPKTIIVGDVHGCYAELRELLFTLRLEQADRLVLVGDLIDKGPASVAVVQHLCQLREVGLSVILVLGNHEEKFARWRKHLAALLTSGLPNPMQAVTARYAHLGETLSEADVNFLDSAVLYARVPGGVVVHAGIPPALTALPPEGAKLTDFVGKEKRLLGQMARVRHVRGSEMVPLGQETPDDPFWAEVYDGRFGRVWFGHAAAIEPEPRQFPHATGLDLGCVYGGRLAAAVLQEGRMPYYVSVSALADYAPLHGVGVAEE